MTGGGDMDSKKPEVRAVGLSAGYGTTTVVESLDLSVFRGEIVGLLGANGAGKTTTLLTLAGILPPLAGRIERREEPRKPRLHLLARSGLGLITEERGVFMGLSCRDNLRVGRVDEEEVVGLFPELGKRMNVKAGSLSGGEQQMLAVGRALARRPVLLLADELSLGLAPLVVDRLLEVIREAVDSSNLGAVIVEQHVQKILGVADRICVMSRGKLVAEGTSDQMRHRTDELYDAYLFAGRADVSVSDNGTGPRHGR